MSAPAWTRRRSRAWHRNLGDWCDCTDPSWGEPILGRVRGLLFAGPVRRLAPGEVGVHRPHAAPDDDASWLITPGA